MFQNNTRFTALILFLFFLCIPFAGAQSLSFVNDSTDYLWPTNASKYLSSTFAETRSAHLHSGIDIRTWGREGYEVYATKDGVLSRVGVSPSGYGNVVYLQHSDDSYSVYAHLNRFEENLQEYVDSIRTIDYTFELDKRFDEHTFHYNKGDLIGFTGSTGVGPPHLHFELRTPENKPFNPLLTNLRYDVVDTIPPVFSALAIEWLRPESFHPRGYQIISPKSTDSTITDFGKITTSNPIGLALDVYDRADRSPNVYAVHQLVMTVDGDTLFHSNADYFSFPEDQMMFLDRSYPILVQQRKGFQRLYNVNGNTLPFYKEKRGVIAMSKGEYDVDIFAQDIYGNESQAMLTIVFDEDIKNDTLKNIPAYPLPGSFTDNERGVAIPLSPLKAPFYYITDQFNELRSDTVHTSDSVFYYFDDTNIVQATLSPGKAHSIHTADRKISLHIPSEALYDSLKFQMKITDHDGYPAFRFTPNRIPIQNSIMFRYQLPDYLANDSQIGLFSYDEYRDRYSFLGSTVHHGVMRAELMEFSELRIRKDIHPPFVGNPRIEKNLGDNYVVIVPTVDAMSGIDYRKSRILVNGKRGIIEYDPEKDFLIFYRPGFEPEETNLIEIKIYDGIGNRAQRTRTVPFQN